LLTPLQQRIATIVQSLTEARGFALAGAGALVVRGLIDRATLDLDFFTVPGEEAAVAALRDALEGELRNEGLTFTRQRDLATFVRLEVSDGDANCQIDLAIDYRALPAEPSSYGPTLAIEELAANKVLALFDRAEARDFLDLDELTRRFDLQSLIDLATEKDPGFDTVQFLEALSSFRRFTPADLGLGEEEYQRLRSSVERWRKQLERNLKREPPEQGRGLDR
jgi:predicted nucleotidyltransferase component of viral defense system